jgi:hypothetical protein
MHHIKRLQITINIYHQGITDLKKYLTSDKFSSDNQVNVKDILLRITEMESRITDSIFEE